MVNTEKLSLRLTACITVCDSRITCIIAVPEYIPLDMQRTLAQQEQRKVCLGSVMAHVIRDPVNS